MTSTQTKSNGVIVMVTWIAKGAEIGVVAFFSVIVFSTLIMGTLWVIGKVSDVAGVEDDDLDRG